MRVHIGTDHAGFELKNRLIANLPAKGHEVTGEAVVADPGSLGIVIGGSGNGEQIAANKVTGVRAALVWNEDTARLAREHNDANVVSVGARQHTEEELEQLIDLFLAEPFSGEERHQRRIDLVGRYETTGSYERGAGSADAAS